MPTKIFESLHPEFKILVRKFCVYFPNEAIIEIFQDDMIKVLLYRNNQLMLVPLMSKFIDEATKSTGIKDFVYSHSVSQDSFIYHMMALTNEGMIFAWGKNTSLQVSYSLKHLAYFSKIIFYRSMAMSKTLRSGIRRIDGLRETFTKETLSHQCLHRYSGLLSRL